MSNSEYHLVGSVLHVNASGVQAQVNQDLQQPDGKSIAELINEQKKEQTHKNNQSDK